MKFIQLLDGTLINVNMIVAVVHTSTDEDQKGYAIKYKFSDGYWSDEEFKTSKEMMDRFLKVATYLLGSPS